MQNSGTSIPLPFMRRSWKGTAVQPGSRSWTSAQARVFSHGIYMPPARTGPGATLRRTRSHRQKRVPQEWTSPTSYLRQRIWTYRQALSTALPPASATGILTTPELHRYFPACSSRMAKCCFCAWNGCLMRTRSLRQVKIWFCSTIQSVAAQEKPCTPLQLHRNCWNTST